MHLRARGFNACIERQKVGLEGDPVDDVDDLTDFAESTKDRGPTCREHLPICSGKQPTPLRKTVCPSSRLRWLALHWSSEGCSDGPSRSSSQEDEPWHVIEKLLSESMSPS